MGKHDRSDVLGRIPRFLPVIGIDLVAYADVAHVLNHLERPYLVSGIRLLIDRIGRAEKDGVDSQAAGKELLGEAQLDLHVAQRNVADVRMSEGVIPDFMPLAVDGEK